MKQDNRVKNEDGAVLVVSLMILVLLTLLGVAISTTSEVELLIAGNERLQKTTFYQAEGAALEGTQLLKDNEPFHHDDSNNDWIHPDDGTVTLANIRDTATWNGNGGNNSATSSQHATASFLAVFEGEGPGTGMGQIFQYGIYGMSIDPTGGQSIVKVGYLTPVSDE